MKIPQKAILFETEAYYQKHIVPTYTKLLRVKRAALILLVTFAIVGSLWGATR